jgi:lycopene beta-cyclase
MGAEVDYTLVGGGLQSALIALALADADPTLRLAIVEREARLGGDHTWCFHEGDVPASMARAVAPLVVHRWPGHEVRFPGLRRRLDGAYCAVTSERLDAVVRERILAGKGRLLLGRTATAIAAREVELDGGERLAARHVIDARGPAKDVVPGTAGYQVFLGQEVELAAPHGLERPIVMDAEVEQRGGFRFLYVLPLAADRLLVEDTVFADSPALDEAALRQRIAAYTAARGWSIARVVREERGVLPMPWQGGPSPRAGWPLAAGYRGGFFHPATGYSFPVAARLAAALAGDPRAGGGAAVAALCADLEGPQRFARALNRLAFRWFDPAERWRVFERFYRLPAATIARFYALEPTALDRARILVGRPPRGFSLRARLGRRAA